MRLGNRLFPEKISSPEAESFKNSELSISNLDGGKCRDVDDIRSIDHFT